MRASFLRHGTDSSSPERDQLQKSPLCPCLHFPQRLNFPHDESKNRMSTLEWVLPTKKEAASPGGYCKG